MLRSWFPNMYPEPDEAPVSSRKSTIYLMRCVFIMGIRWPPKRFFVIYCLWSFALNLCSTFYQPIAFQISYFIHLHELSAGEFLTSIQVAFNAISCSAKVLIFWVLCQRLDRALDVLDELDQRVTQKSERRLVHAAVARSNFVFFLYMTIYMIYATTTFLSAVVNGRPPYQNYYPVLDWRASSGQFWLQALLEYYAMAGACFQDVCLDCYPINYVLPLRAHMSIFANRLRQLGRDAHETPAQRHEALINCIKDHKTMLRFCDTLRPVISGTIFVQFCVVGIVLGFTLINLVMFSTLSTGIGTISFMIAVILETTPFCMLCNYLIDDCNNLADALFESNWIKAEQRYKKTLVYFLHKLQQPIVFMAMNVFPITVGTNINVTKFAFSVFTLVKQMNIAEKFGKNNNPEML